MIGGYPLRDGSGGVRGPVLPDILFLQFL